MAKNHPMQPIVRDGSVARFKQNAIINYLLENGGIDINALALKNFSTEDRMQFAQLIGYSVSGYGDLPYATEKSKRKARKRAKKLWKKRK